MDINLYKCKFNVSSYPIKPLYRTVAVVGTLVKNTLTITIEIYADEFFAVTEEFYSSSVGSITINIDDLLNKSLVEILNTDYVLRQLNALDFPYTNLKHEMIFNSFLFKLRFKNLMENKTFVNELIIRKLVYE